MPGPSAPGAFQPTATLSSLSTWEGLIALNLVVTTDARVKVVDFGIVQLTNATYVPRAHQRRVAPPSVIDLAAVDEERLHRYVRDQAPAYPSRFKDVLNLGLEIQPPKITFGADAYLYLLHGPERVGFLWIFFAN